MHESPREPWDDRIKKILKRIDRDAINLLILGWTVYGGGSLLILWLMKGNPTLATAAVMYFFQILVVYFTTRKIYPCIAGGFHLGLEANRDSVPLFERLSDAVDAIERDPENNPAVKAVLDGIERRFSEKVAPVIETWQKIGDRLSRDFDEGALEEIRAAARGLREMTTPKGAPPDAGAVLARLEARRKPVDGNHKTSEREEAKT